MQPHLNGDGKSKDPETDNSSHPFHGDANLSRGDFSASALVRDEDVHEHDVLCGRGGDIHCHVGNERFRKLVDERRHLYVTAIYKREKRLISGSIVQEIHNLKPPGRFLARVPGRRRKRNKKNCDISWYEVPFEKAREKASQALRDGAPSLKKYLEHQNGQISPNIRSEGPSYGLAISGPILTSESGKSSYDEKTWNPAFISDLNPQLINSSWDDSRRNENFFLWKGFAEDSRSTRERYNFTEEETDLLLSLSKSTELPEPSNIAQVDLHSSFSGTIVESRSAVNSSYISAASKVAVHDFDSNKQLHFGSVESFLQSTASKNRLSNPQEQTSPFLKDLYQTYATGSFSLPLTNASLPQQNCLLIEQAPNSTQQPFFGSPSLTKFALNTTTANHHKANNSPSIHRLSPQLFSHIYKAHVDSSSSQDTAQPVRKRSKSCPKI